MKEILIGQKYRKEMIVKEEDLASSWGSGKARVYATPMMTAFMELTSTECIDIFLENDEITVGTMVNIKHIKATALSKTVICECEIIETKGKSITLNVVCYVDGEIIGKGTHSRYVVNKGVFETSVNI